MLNHALLSDALGYLSILCWLGAQFPQVIVNIRTKSVEGLALPFLANWLFGDITNLVGCILTHQLPFQTYLASYFVFVDMSLVAQYIYYYKPPLPSSPDYSPLSSRPPSSLAMTMTPTAVVYSPRNLTRPSSRTPLLLSEVEAGYRTYEKRARSQTGSSRYSGILSSYPPAGLLPSADEVEGGKGKARRLSSKHSVSSLHRHHSEKSGHEDKSREDGAITGEEDDEVSAMTESFYSDVSSPPGAGEGRGGMRRHVSWSRALSESAIGGDTTGDNTPRQGIVQQQQPPPALSRNPDSVASTSSAGGLTASATQQQQQQQQQQQHSASLEDMRKRSRSRGRASRRHRPTPLLVYELASPTGLVATAGASTSGFDGDGSAQQLLHLSAAARDQEQRDSKSGSRRRRSASIVFLSVGFGALLAFSGRGGGGATSAVSVTPPSTPSYGRVLGSDAAPPASYWDAMPQGSSSGFGSEDFVPLYPVDESQEEEDVRTKHRRRPHDSPPLTPEQKRRLLGRISAWACTTLYLTSRLPQIWKNYTRKSVQGLSLALFVFAFLGNTFYVASILSSPKIWEYPPIEGEPSTLGSTPLEPPPPYDTPRARAFLRESLPYLLGSGGTLCFDIIIVSQGIIYGRREKQRLLEEDDEEEEEEEEEESEREHGEGGSQADGEGSSGEAGVTSMRRASAPTVAGPGSAPVVTVTVEDSRTAGDDVRADSNGHGS